MKGLALKYVFSLIVAIVLIVVSINFILNFLKPIEAPEPGITADMRYFCSRRNHTSIRKEELKLLLKAFLEGQCNYFVGKMAEDVSMRELEMMVNTLVLSKEDCSLPETATRTLFVSGELRKGVSFNITRREIKNSDVLICGSS